MKRSLLFTLILLLVYPIWAEQYIVILSLDGFRADYPEKYNAKNIIKIGNEGVRVKRLIPSNPTKTFPNHYTIATGLHPEKHGLIGNAFYSPKLQKEYRIGNRTSVEDGDFYGGEPIWNTARKAGLRTASFFWVGSEAKVQGMRPHLWKRYDESISFPQRIDSVISWLKLPEPLRPRLVMMYYDEPDHSGHVFGPDSQEVGEQVRYVDEQVGALYEKLMQLPFADKINFIIVSDHGMRGISEDKQIILQDYLKKEWIEGIYGGNPVYTINARSDCKDSIYDALRRVKHLRVFKSGEVPRRFHLGNHRNSGDFTIIAEKYWSVFTTRTGRRYLGGTHGYLNSDKQMSAIFVAKGTAFKSGYTKNRIKNIDIYNLLARILNIAPAPNDGKFRRVKGMLKK